MPTQPKQSNKNIEELIEKFEDNLLAESHNNEDGLLICEIDIFRRYATQALAQAHALGRQEAAQELVKFTDQDEMKEYLNHVRYNLDVRERLRPDCGMS